MNVNYLSVDASWPAFCDEYTAVYNNMTDKPDATNAAYQNTMVEALVDGGYWARMDLFYCMAQAYEDEAKLNWVNPGTYDLTEVGAGSLTWTQYEGFISDGTNYLNTGWIPSTHAVNAGQDDITMGAYIIGTDANTPDAVMGTLDGSGRRLQMYTRYSGNLDFYANNLSTLSRP